MRRRSVALSRVLIREVLEAMTRTQYSIKACMEVLGPNLAQSRPNIICELILPRVTFLKGLMNIKPGYFEKVLTR